ncbi:hypothetical protein NW754_006501 [Fusarium falciforme]|nr:hypothetical protein NW754_006501 [Fusarium falciforme]KAJ4209016.1 hypothetical protein NW767_000925 [Fusarium falciforme]KAJ4262327.1 hypothetical protein NW757_000585 [Fusarium falciforme]
MVGRARSRRSVSSSSSKPRPRDAKGRFTRSQTPVVEQQASVEQTQAPTSEWDAPAQAQASEWDVPAPAQASEWDTPAPTDLASEWNPAPKPGSQTDDLGAAGNAQDLTRKNDSATGLD